MNEDRNLANAQLEAAIWYVKHKLILRRIVIGLIVAVDAALMLYAGFGVGRDLFHFGTRREQEFELLKTAVPVSTAAQTSGPADLQLRGVELLRIGEVTDIIARVQNPNLQWYVRFQYTMGLGDETETFDDGFLLPGQEGTLLRSLRGASGTVVFNVESVSWRRVNRHEIPDFEVWRAERINFEVSKAQFSPAAVEGKGSVSRAQFIIKNKSAYSYVAPRFLILLYRGSRLAAIQSTVIDRFRTGEEREVAVSWFDRVGAVSNIEVVPVIDIMDEGVYMKPG